MRFGSLLALSLVLTACSEKPTEPAPGSGAAATTHQAPATARPSTATRPKPPPQKKRLGTEPHVMKAYHADRCYLGLVALGFARTAYEKSLGKDRPGPKIPDFGAPEAQSGNAAQIYQRLVRTCNAAGSADKPEHAQLDKALDAAVEVGPPLGQAITDASDYYLKKEQEKDAFAKGRELHTAIKKGFDKLDDVTKAVAEALPLYRKDVPINWEAAPAKATQVVADRAMATFVMLAQGKDAAEIDKAIAEITAAMGEVEKAVKTLRGDPYGAFIPKTAQDFIDKAKAANQDRSPARLVDAASELEDLLEAQNNAYKRDRAGIVEEGGPMADPHHGMK